jgi:hypothetical protein
MVVSVVRSVLSVVAGLVLAFVFIVLAEVLSSIYHPWPAGVDVNDYEVCKAHVRRYPTWLLAVCTAIWAAAPLSGAWLATRLGTGRHASHGFVVGAVLLALAGFNMAMLPYPVWFLVVNLVTFPLGTFLGVRLARGARMPRG